MLAFIYEWILACIIIRPFAKTADPGRIAGNVSAAMIATHSDSPVIQNEEIQKEQNGDGSCVYGIAVKHDRYKAIYANDYKPVCKRPRPES